MPTNKTPYFKGQKFLYPKNNAKKSHSSCDNKTVLSIPRKIPIVVGKHVAVIIVRGRLARRSNAATNVCVLIQFIGGVVTHGGKGGNQGGARQAVPDVVVVVSICVGAHKGRGYF